MIRRKHEAATLAATFSEVMPRIEIVADRRRSHGAAFRAGVIAESAAPGARVQEVAARHGICPSLIYRWRRARAAASAAKPIVQLLPVRITSADASPSFPSSPSVSPTGCRAGLIEIDLPGDVRVRVDESISLAALRRVVSVLRG